MRRRDNPVAEPKKPMRTGESLLPPNRLIVEAPASYVVRVTRDPVDIGRAQVLRYQVFNLEMNSGQPAAWGDGLDEDEFDPYWDHLVVEHVPTGALVGTYRLQTGAMAAAGRGYYSAGFFDFSPFAKAGPEMVELGRACVHKQHRNMLVLGLLWRGIATYAKERGARYLCGCSSLSSQDPAAGATAYANLCRHHLAAPAWRTRPRAKFECSLRELAAEAPPIPKLLRAYLAIGAKICGPPALDREFKTIVFLTLLDLQALPAETKRRFGL